MFMKILKSLTHHFLFATADDANKSNIFHKTTFTVRNKTSPSLCQHSLNNTCLTVGAYFYAFWYINQEYVIPGNRKYI